MNENKRIYADHSATTQVRQEVVNTMVNAFQENFGNPSSLHSYGKKAKVKLKEARSKIGTVLNSNPENIIFTSGGTEANNLVILGLAKELPPNKKKHIITTKIEHSSIKDPLEYLEEKGWNISWLDVDKEGFIDLNQLKSFISSETLLVTIIHGNNEIGTIQNLKEISSICRKNNVLFHSDCVQTFCKIPVDVKKLDIDFVTISGHKVYGPKGIGALYVKDLTSINPIFMGGGQEYGIRPGTEPMPNIIGFGIASELLNSEMSANEKKLRSLQLKLEQGLSKSKNLIFTGPPVNNRLPGHISFCVNNISGESLVLQLDLKNIAVSSASACLSNKSDDDEIKPSHVIKALCLPAEYEKGSIRISLGKDNTEDEVQRIISSLQEILNKF